MIFYEPNTSHISFVKVLLQQTLCLQMDEDSHHTAVGELIQTQMLQQPPNLKVSLSSLSEIILPNLHLTYTTWYWQTGNIGKRINTVSANKNHLAK